SSKALESALYPGVVGRPAQPADKEFGTHLAVSTSYRLAFTSRVLVRVSELPLRGTARPPWFRTLFQFTPFGAEWRPGGVRVVAAKGRDRVSPGTLRTPARPRSATSHPVRSPPDPRHFQRSRGSSKGFGWRSPPRRRPSGPLGDSDTRTPCAGSCEAISTVSS